MSVFLATERGAALCHSALPRRVRTQWRRARAARTRHQSMIDDETRVVQAGTVRSELKPFGEQGACCRDVLGISELFSA